MKKKNKMKTQLSTLTLLVLLCLVFFCGCQNEKDKDIVALKKAINELKYHGNDTLKNIAELNTDPNNEINIDEIKKILNYTSENTKYELEDLIRTHRLSPFNYGAPTSKAELPQIFNQRNSSETDYVYFYKEDFETLLNAGSCNGQRGVRIYLRTIRQDRKKISDPNVNHPFAGKRSVYLQSMCGDVEIEATDLIHSIYDFGDVCPPNCAPHGTKNGRTIIEVKDGEKPK